MIGCEDERFYYRIEEIQDYILTQKSRKMKYYDSLCFTFFYFLILLNKIISLQHIT